MSQAQFSIPTHEVDAITRAPGKLFRLASGFVVGERLGPFRHLFVPHCAGFTGYFPGRDSVLDTERRTMATASFDHDRRVIIGKTPVFDERGRTRQELLGFAIRKSDDDFAAVRSTLDPSNCSGTGYMGGGAFAPVRQELGAAIRIGHLHVTEEIGFAALPHDLRALHLSTTSIKSAEGEADRAKCDNSSAYQVEQNIKGAYAAKLF